VTTVRILGASEHTVLGNVAPDVFDGAPNPALSQEFLTDPRHHLAVAIEENGLVVGMASGVHYVHPDKDPQMFINEVGVSAAYEGQGLGKRLIAALLQRATELGCTEAWTATEPENARAQALYSKAGGVRDPTPFVMFTFPLAARGSSGDASSVVQP
jgi:ribosomal protein S18 acetylase RimI-like enzyme